MKQLKIFGLPVASFGEPDARPRTPSNAVIAGGLIKKPGTGVPQTQGIFLSPRYEPSNITQNADVLRVQDAIRLAENGQTQELFRFYRDVLLSDDHIQSCFNTRKLAVLSNPLNVLPKDKNNPDDAALAAAMTRAIDDCENWNTGMLALMDSNGFWPVSIVERLFRPADEGGGDASSPKLQFTLRRFAPVNHQLECYFWAYLMGGVGLGTASAIQIANVGTEGKDAAPPGTRIDDWRGPAGPGGSGDQYTIDLERWEPYLKLWPIDRAGRIIYDTSNASYLDPARHVVHRGHLLTTMRDNWGGPARAILMWWLFRQLGREWFARGMERYGSPFPVGYTDATDPVAVALLNQAFDLAKKLGGLVVDESSRIELKEAMVQGMAQGYETFYRLCNEAISYHITGIKESQKPAGLNSGQSQMQQSVRDDVRLMDMMLLGETCKNQIAKPFAQINGLKGAVKFVWGGLSDDDAKKFADMLQVMSQAGLTVSEESLPIVNERTGLSWEKAEQPQANGNEDESVFDPTKDIVAQRALWRESLKRNSAETDGEIVRLSADWITIDGHPVYIGDKKKGSTEDKKSGILKGQSHDPGTGKTSTDARRSPGTSAHFVGGGRQTADSGEASWRDQQQRIRDEEGRLRDWAEQNRILGGKLPPEDDRGGEHIVHFDEKSGRYLKATYQNQGNGSAGYGVHVGSFENGSSPSEYLDRLDLQNKFFDDDIRVERIVPVNKGVAGPRYSIVTSQPAIKGSPAPEHEIDTMMAGKGFEKIGHGAYYHEKDRTAVYDMKGAGHEQANVLKTASGRIQPIDPIIQRMSPDLARDFSRSPKLQPLSALTWLSANAEAKSPVDDVTARHAAALAQAFRGSLAPVRQILLNSTSRADAEHKLKLFFADWKPERIASVVEEAMQICAAKGVAEAKK